MTSKHDLFLRIDPKLADQLESEATKRSSELSFNLSTQRVVQTILTDYFDGTLSYAPAQQDPKECDKLIEAHLLSGTEALKGLLLEFSLNVQNRLNRLEGVIGESRDKILSGVSESATQLQSRISTQTAKIESSLKKSVSNRGQVRGEALKPDFSRIIEEEMHVVQDHKQEFCWALKKEPSTPSDGLFRESAYNINLSGDVILAVTPAVVAELDILFDTNQANAVLDALETVSSEKPFAESAEFIEQAIKDLNENYGKKPKTPIKNANGLQGAVPGSYDKPAYFIKLKNFTKNRFENYDSLADDSGGFPIFESWIDQVANSPEMKQMGYGLLEIRTQIEAACVWSAKIEESRRKTVARVDKFLLSWIVRSYEESKGVKGFKGKGRVSAAEKSKKIQSGIEKFLARGEKVVGASEGEGKDATPPSDPQGAFDRRGNDILDVEFSVVDK